MIYRTLGRSDLGVAATAWCMRMCKFYGPRDDAELGELASKIITSSLEEWFIGHAHEIANTLGASVSELRGDAAAYEDGLLKKATTFFREWLSTCEATTNIRSNLFAVLDIERCHFPHPTSVALFSPHNEPKRSFRRRNWVAIATVRNTHDAVGEVRVEFRNRKNDAVAVGRVDDDE